MKIFFAAFAGIMLLFAPLPVWAVDIAGNMAVGTWSSNARYMTFGNYNGHSLVWRVLEVKKSDSGSDGTKTAVLLLNDLLRDKNGNPEATEYGKSNSFPDSRIKERLNDSVNGFMSTLEAFQADILETTYGPDNGALKWSDSASNCTSRIFLLSVNEANNKKYFENEADRAANGSWWLRSPGHDNETATSVLHFGGIARNGPFVSGKIGIRPALRIKLSPSSSFENVPVSYRLTVKADDGKNPVAGAKISFTPMKESQTKNYFSDSTGTTRYENLAAGEYIVTVSKTGFITKSANITVPTIATISLLPDPSALPYVVKFGKYNRNPIEWNVLDIVDGRALLLAGALFPMNFDTKEGSNIWADSSLRDYLNSSDAETFPQENIFTMPGGFLQEANFTAAEIAAIDATASATGDAVFLLSIDEVYTYLTDANMRYFDDKQWLTRTPGNDDAVQLISPDGEHGGGIPANTRNLLGWVRPAVWVNLSKLIYDKETNMFVAVP